MKCKVIIAHCCFVLWRKYECRVHLDIIVVAIMYCCDLRTAAATSSLGAGWRAWIWPGCQLPRVGPGGRAGGGVSHMLYSPCTRLMHTCMRARSPRSCDGCAYACVPVSGILFHNIFPLSDWMSEWLARNDGHSTAQPPQTRAGLLARRERSGACLHCVLAWISATLPGVVSK